MTTTLEKRSTRKKSSQIILSFSGTWSNLIYNFTLWNMQNILVSQLLSFSEYIQRSEWAQNLLSKSKLLKRLQRRMLLLISRMIYWPRSIRTTWYSVPLQQVAHIQKFYHNLNRVQRWRNLSCSPESEHEKPWTIQDSINHLRRLGDLYAPTYDWQIAGLQIHTTNSDDISGKPTTLPAKLARYSKPKPQRAKKNG